MNPEFKTAWDQLGSKFYVILYVGVAKYVKTRYIYVKVKSVHVIVGFKM